MPRVRVVEEENSKMFRESYLGPMGAHLSCLTNFTTTGQRKYSGTKRPGKLLMAALGQKYDPHKNRFSLPEDAQVRLGMLRENHF